MKPRYYNLKKTPEETYSYNNNNTTSALSLRTQNSPFLLPNFVKTVFKIWFALFIWTYLELCVTVTTEILSGPYKEFLKKENCKAMSSNEWVRYPRPKPQARLRLFCFHYAGGGASAFRTWERSIPPEIELALIQLPGRENRAREKAFTHLISLVDELTDTLLPLFDKPFVFFGHSLGALISFELARQLRRQQGPAPLHLFVSGCRAPQRPIPASEVPIHFLPDDEFIQKLREYNGTPEAVLQHAELMDLLMPVLRADFALYETYVYQPEEPLSCSISAFGGLQDPKVSREDVAAWREQTQGDFVLRMFPGDHFFLHSTQAQLLQTVSQDLARILRHHY